MVFHETPLKGAYTLDLQKVEDERGFFARIWCRRELELHGITGNLAQASLSFNRWRDTLRGMHFQAPPHEETKIVRCMRGRLHDVIVDLRPASPTYTKWFGVELSAENRQALIIPPGFAHGFQTLENATEILYLISEFYHAEAARGVRWNDPVLAIEWPEADRRIISQKDQTWPDFIPA